MKWCLKGFAVICLLILLPGCGKKEIPAVLTEPSAVETSPQKPVEVTAAEEPKTRPEENPLEPLERQEINGQIQSYLTGEMVPVSQGNRRPIAVMISNDKESLPNYGLSQAGVVYEAPVEGDINRYMALIENYDSLDRIGSVRSVRTYYIFFAREFDAICVHYGQSTFAKPYLQYIDDINGMEGVGGAAFYRSSDRKAPHNAYTSFDKIQTAISAYGFRQSYDSEYKGHYLFASKNHPAVFNQPDVMEAYRVVPGYKMNNPWFEYHEDDGLYYRYQYGKLHEDSQGPLAVKNIIIQYCQSGYYATTPYLNINVHTDEWGYYISEGKAIPIHWSKDGEYGVTHYYDTQGQEIFLNPGKTWVCVISTKDTARTEIHGKE